MSSGMVRNPIGGAGSRRVNERRSLDLTSVEGVVKRQNMLSAWKQVKANKGACGIDNISIEQFPRYAQENWEGIKQSLLEGEYHPSPVKRVEIPKDSGGTRKLGIPTVIDRVIQQAISQVLTPVFDPHFSESSFGFRPGRSAHQAVHKVLKDIGEGYRYVVDIDLEKFLETSSYCTPFHERVSKRVGWIPNTLIYKPFRFPERTWTAESSPRFTRCNTVWRETPRSLVASSIDTWPSGTS
jgi:hypothetical protein